MSSAEKFCLRWNDFESNISVAFREIRDEKDFFDCTLSCGTRQIQAHKLILSACSPFFRSILKQNPHQHPLLYLKGMEYTDLQAVLNFMYHGEVNVAQEELNSFLTVAEDLQVKGLTQNNKSSSEAPPELKSEASVVPPKPRYSKQHPNTTIPQSTNRRPTNITRTHPHSTDHYGSTQQDEDVQEVSIPEVKKEPTSRAYGSPDPLTQQMDMANSDEVHTTIGMQMATTDESYAEEGYDYGEYDDGSGMMAGYQGGQGMDASLSQGDVVDAYALKIESGKYSCKVCGFVTRDKYNIRWHLEGKHELGAGYECENCKEVVKTKKHLTQHKLHCF